MPLWGHQLLSSNKLLEPLGTLCHRIDHYLYASSFYYNPVGFPLSNLKKKKKKAGTLRKKFLDLAPMSALEFLIPGVWHVNGSQSEKSVPKDTVEKNPSLTSSCGTEKGVPVPGWHHQMELECTDVESRGPQVPAGRGWLGYDKDSFDYLLSTPTRSCGGPKDTLKSDGNFWPQQGSAWRRRRS